MERKMRKFFYALGLFLINSALNALYLEQYITFQNQQIFGKKFNAETDLIRGLVALRNGTLSEHRHFGNISFSKPIGEGCSYFDTSSDPVTQLLITLFPSVATTGLNTSGPESIEKLCNNRENFMRMIAGMLNLASDTRKIIAQKFRNKELADVIEVFKQGSDTLSLDQERHLLKYIIGDEAKSVDLNVEAKALINKQFEYIKGVLEQDIPAFLKRYGGDRILVKNSDSGEIEVKQNQWVKATKIIMVALHKENSERKNAELAKEIEECYKNLKRQIMLLNLAKNIVAGVMHECIKTGDNSDNQNKNWKENPYYRGYVTNIICAYAWTVCTDKDLPIFAAFLDSNNEQVSYTSELSQRIYKYDKSGANYTPWDSGVIVISNDTADFCGNKFPDCAETTIRQIIALLLCSGDGFEGSQNIELNRISKNSELETFCNGKTIGMIANDGGSEIRDQWANICGGLRNKWKVGNVLYKTDEFGGFEVKADWRNIIKIICWIMRDYKADNDKEGVENEQIRSKKERAQKLIEDVNKNGYKAEDPKNITETLNVLLGIRGDVCLEAESHNNLRVFGDIIVGDIEIRVPGIKGNRLEVYVTRGHANCNIVDENEGIPDLKGLVPNDPYSSGFENVIALCGKNNLKKILRK